jgi:hypothetical protein
MALFLFRTRRRDLSAQKLALRSPASENWNEILDRQAKGGRKAIELVNINAKLTIRRSF